MLIFITNIKWNNQKGMYYYKDYVVIYASLKKDLDEADRLNYKDKFLQADVFQWDVSEVKLPGPRVIVRSVMKKNLMTIVLFGLVLSIIGCIKEDPTTTDALPIKAVSSELVIVSSSNKVDDFLIKNKNFTKEYETDICYNITPDFIANNSDYSIFKYASSTASFLLFDDEIYALGTYFGGNGLTSMALGDLNEDDQYELYFTFSWGSGLHRSQIGYFDPCAKKVMVFDYSYLNYDMILTTNEEGTLCVNEATIEGVSFVDFIVKSNQLVANIVWEKNSIKLNVIEMSSLTK